MAKKERGRERERERERKRDEIKTYTSRVSFDECEKFTHCPPRFSVPSPFPMLLSRACRTLGCPVSGATVCFHPGGGASTVVAGALDIKDDDDDAAAAAAAAIDAPFRAPISPRSLRHWRDPLCLPIASPADSPAAAPDAAAADDDDDDELFLFFLSSSLDTLSIIKSVETSICNVFVLSQFSHF